MPTYTLTYIRWYHLELPQRNSIPHFYFLDNDNKNAKGTDLQRCANYAQLIYEF